METEKINHFLEIANEIFEGINNTAGPAPKITMDDYLANAKLNDVGLDSLGVYEFYLHLETFYEISAKTVRNWLEDKDIRFIYLQNAVEFVEANKQTA